MEDGASIFLNTTVPIEVGGCVETRNATIIVPVSESGSKTVRPHHIRVSIKVRMGEICWKIIELSSSRIFHVNENVESEKGSA